MSEKIIIFDTTLRDGEQSPGASLNIHEKIEIARQLEKLNVDIIEAGFPVSSSVQFDAVERVAGEVGITVASLARAMETDIKAAYDAVKGAENFRIHTFLGTSDVHLQGKFGDSRYGASINEKRGNILKMACDAIAYGKTFTNDIEFSPEDAGRTDISFLCEIIEAAIEAGATTINIPDTTGYTMPQEFGEKISEIKKRVFNIDSAVISAHCHDDLGLAVANSLSALNNGARQVECTINGIGERAGNAALEEIVMAIKVRGEYWGFHTDIRSEEIYNSSIMVSSFTGMIVQPNKAIIGDNAFAHESGIHQDGVLKMKETYEIMTPESVGLPDSKIVLGRHSGRHGLQSRLKQLGYSISKKQLDSIYKDFVQLADKKKEVFDDDLRVLMGDETRKKDERYQLLYLNLTLGTSAIPTATIQLKADNRLLEESATGDGPVDACFNAIDRALDTKSHIESYQVRSITGGRQAQGEVLVRVRKDDRSFVGKGFSTDIIEASAKAYLKALEEQYMMTEKKGFIEMATTP